MKLRSRILGVLLVGAVAAALNVVGGGVAHAAQVGNPVAAAPVPSGFVKIKNFGSGKCAEVNRFGNQAANGELVVQRTCDDNVGQMWSPVAIGGNVYLFVNHANGQCMDVRDGRNADRTPIQQWPCTGTQSMRWTLDPDSFEGVHQVVSQIGGRCLDVAGGSLAEGAQIQLFRCTGFGNAAQVWSFPAA